jgi:hypothetical protein
MKNRKNRDEISKIKKTSIHPITHFQEQPQTSAMKAKNKNIKPPTFQITFERNLVYIPKPLRILNSNHFVKTIFQPKGSYRNRKDKHKNATLQITL